MRIVLGNTPSDSKVYDDDGKEITNIKSIGLNVHADSFRLNEVSITYVMLKGFEIEVPSDRVTLTCTNCRGEDIARCKYCEGIIQVGYPCQDCP
jgi:predicted RNA-binding Zn-ribbon protein involved in translation (DUF1610 family)